MSPERDGWHWFVRGDFYSLALWHRGHFTFQDTTAWPEEFSQLDMTYAGPVLTPAEVEARVADALKWRGAINDALTNWLSPIEDHETPEDALQRLIRLEVMAALDPAVSRPAADLVAKAKRDGRQEVARQIDCGCDIRAAVLERLESQGERQAEWLCPKGDTCCALQAAAIRAMKGEGDE
jgi:hypothetical protein